MKTSTSKIGTLAGVLLFILAALPATASFTSLYCFGDGVCTTTHPHQPANQPLYHEGRFCNGRVWVELLTNWQGLPYDPAKNDSDFGHDSVKLLAFANAFDDTFPAPDAATSLVIVWAANADMVEFLSKQPPLGYDEGNIPAWTTLITEAITRHEQAVTTLYNKGVRTLIMPSAADVTQTPLYSTHPHRLFVRDRAIQYNAALAAAIASLSGSLTGLTIHHPDVFGFVDQVVADPSDFGMVNPTGPTGTQGGVLAQTPPYSFRGPEADYVFWDFWHPTAKFQMYLADFVQHMIWPVQITDINTVDANTQLHIENIPQERQGYVDSRAGLVGPWGEDVSIFEPLGTGSSSRMVPAPKDGSTRFYRARFPVVWTWP